MKINLFKKILCIICLVATNFIKPATQTKEPKETWIVVFVHGIMSIKPHVRLNNILRFMRDDVENTIYSKTVETMRADSFFYENQAMQEFGLKTVDMEQVGPGQASSGIASIINEVQLMMSDKKFDNYYYTFGWTGLLSPSRRYKDAITLYESLEKEIAKFKRKGIHPKIRLIGYSHGGNVVLNLGAVRQKENVNKSLVIDETILMGMPVQNETDYLINDPLFKKIYHIYSTGDRVQTLDCFSYDRFFSNRIFYERATFKLPKKLVQIQLKLTRNTKSCRASKRKFALTYNFQNSLIVSGKSHLLRDSSPGHAELWFFGWTPVHYRQSFALNPLPAVAILPFILKTVQDIEHLVTPYHPVIVDIRPEHGVTLIKNVSDYDFYDVIDFIPTHDLEKLKEKALLYVPECFSIEEYDAHIRKACMQAQEYYKDQWSVKSKKRRRRIERRKSRSS